MLNTPGSVLGSVKRNECSPRPPTHTHSRRPCRDKQVVQKQGRGLIKPQYEPWGTKRHIYTTHIVERDQIKVNEKRKERDRQTDTRCGNTYR